MPNRIQRDADRSGMIESGRGYNMSLDQASGVSSGCRVRQCVRVYVDPLRTRGAGYIVGNTQGSHGDKRDLERLPLPMVKGHPIRLGKRKLPTPYPEAPCPHQPNA